MTFALGKTCLLDLWANLNDRTFMRKQGLTLLLSLTGLLSSPWARS